MHADVWCAAGPVSLAVAAERDARAGLPRAAAAAACVGTIPRPALPANPLMSCAGTVTPNTPDASVDRLQPLLAFLGHQPYGTEPDTWKRAVQVPTGM